MNTEDTNHGQDSQAATEPHSEPISQSPAGDSTLETLAREEQTYLRERLRQELGREPTQDEIDQWLNEHTEGY